MMAQRQTDDRSALESTQRWKALLFIGISVLVISLDNTILNVALPSISRQLGASASALQWIVDAYILVFASLLLTMGAIGDRIGRKRTLQAGLMLFGLGSLAAALAPSTATLIAARAFLGIGGAAILPGTLSIIAATFRDQHERAKAIGIWSAVFGLGVGLGPLIGGWLLTRFAWSTVFYVNLPVVAIALLGGQAFIAESRDATTRRLDIPGVLLSIPGLFALLYGIIAAGSVGWTHPSVLLPFGAAAALLGVFAVWERRTPNAMLPLRFFANRSFGGTNLALVLIMFANTGSVFILSPYFQSVQGYSALTTGLLLLPTAVLVTVGSALSARLSGRFGVKVTVGGGILLAAVGLLALAQVAAVDTVYTTLFPALALFALGLGVAIPAATSSVLGSVPVDRAGVGSGMNDTTRLLGSALGVAVLGTILNAVYTVRCCHCTPCRP
jgi:EmrB/QacA subfamily drug resistance transporter